MKKIRCICGNKGDDVREEFYGGAEVYMETKNEIIVKGCKKCKK